MLTNYHPGVGESSLIFSLLCHIREMGERNPVLAAFNLRILKQFRKEGMEFPFPTRTIQVMDDRTSQ